MTLTTENQKKAREIADEIAMAVLEHHVHNRISGDYDMRPHVTEIVSALEAAEQKGAQNLGEAVELLQIAADGMLTPSDARKFVERFYSSKPDAI